MLMREEGGAKRGRDWLTRQADFAFERESLRGGDQPIPDPVDGSCHMGLHVPLPSDGGGGLSVGFG